MVSMREAQQTTGRLSWVAGILPRARWAVSIMYAVLAGTKRSEEEEKRRATRRADQRLKMGLIAVKRPELPRQWFMNLLMNPERLALRTEPMEEQLPDYAIVTDASLTGIGALLATMDHTMGQPSPSSRRWRSCWRSPMLVGWGCRGMSPPPKLMLRSDSVVALSVAKRLASPLPVINWVGAELAIRFERRGIKRVITQHIPGNWNVEPDWLSRPQGRGSMPERLRNAPIKSRPRNLMHISTRQGLRRRSRAQPPARCQEPLSCCEGMMEKTQR